MSPIRESQKKRYPANWKEIRARILKRADNRCEVCGVRNHELIVRRADALERYYYVHDFDSEVFPWFPREEEYRHRHGPALTCCEVDDDWRDPVKVILTVAHLDHTPEHNDDDNLKALCQLHHLRHDAKEHGKNAAATRRARGSRAQIDLFGGDDGG